MYFEQSLNISFGTYEGFQNKGAPSRISWGDNWPSYSWNSISKDLLLSQDSTSIIRAIIENGRNTEWLPMCSMSLKNKCLKSYIHLSESVPCDSRQKIRDVWVGSNVRQETLSGGTQYVLGSQDSSASFCFTRCHLTKSKDLGTPKIDIEIDF